MLMASAAMSVLAFAVPLTVLQVYDRIVAYRSLSTHVWLSLGCVCAIVLNALLEYGRSVLASWNAARFVQEKDRQLIERLFETDPLLVGKHGTVRHLERLRTLSPAANTAIARVLPALVDAPFVIVYLVVLVFIGRAVSLVGISAVVMESALVFASRKALLKSSFLAERAERSRVSYLAYALDRLHFVKAQALEHVVLRGFEQVQASELRANEHRASLNRRLDEAGRILHSATTFGTIIVGGVLVSRGSLTVGSVSASLFFATRIISIVQNLRRAVFAGAEAGVDLREVARGLELPRRLGAREPDLPRSIEGRLEFENVGYDDPAGAGSPIPGLSFIVRPGEIVSVASREARGNGPDAGSAVCRLAAGLAAPSGGRVFIDAYSSDRWHFLGRGGAVAYLSSRSGVLPGSILDNASSFDPGRRDGAFDVARLLELDEVVSRLPRGFETQIGPNNYGGLSASAIRLVTVVRALALRPRVFLWDRADANLDEAGRSLVLNLMGKLRGTMTVAINSADPEFRALASREVAG